VRRPTESVQTPGGVPDVVIQNIATDAQGMTSNAFLVAPGEGDGEAGSGGDADGRTVLVDAGANFDAVARVREAVGDLDGVVLTHTHPDHVGNVDALREAFGVETWGYDTDEPAVDNAIADGDELRLGARDYRALYTPGHATDHLCLYAADAGVLFAGDLVFANGGFGRTDFPGCDRGDLIDSIDRVLETVREGGLDQLHTGHGPSVVDDPLAHVERASQAARTG